MKMTDTAVRVSDAWWCEEHHDIHLGVLDSWTMEHRLALHPLFVHWRTEVSKAPTVVRRQAFARQAKPVTPEPPVRTPSRNSPTEPQ